LRADAEVLLRGKKRLDMEDAVLLEHIVTETDHMTHLTTNLLDLARLDHHAAHQEHEVLDLARLAKQCVQRVKALAAQRDIRVEENYAGNLYIIGDQLLLEQAILVLLDNAIKYNRSGGSLAVRASSEERSVLFEVSDTGIGIPAEHLSNLGERFYRVDKARARAAGGTGLGLSIARGIASIHNGQLVLRSSPGEGTTASLIFPLAHGNRKNRGSGESASEQVI
jgi:signal transduction histidine kinase